MMLRLVMALALVLASLPTPAHAGDCHEFDAVRRILLSEVTRQPLDTKIEVARVIVTKGPCYLDPDFYTGYGVALSAGARGDFANHHWRAYNDPDSFPSDVQEEAALAAHVALTEEPRVRRFHFDAASAPAAFWWESSKACPDGWWISGELRVC